MHTAHPETTGNYAGSNRILSELTTHEASLSDLVKSQRDYVGDYISSAGQIQLAAFASIPDKRWVIGVHRSKQELIRDIEKGMKVSKTGFYIICGLLMPLSWVLIYLTFQLAERKRKKAEASLEESEEKFRGFSEQSLVGIYLIQGSVFKYVNPKFAEIFGYTVEECLNNMPFHDLVLPVDIPMVEEQVRKRIAGETKSVHYEFRGIKKSGETVLVEIFGSSLAIDSEPAAIGTMLDISKRRKAEIALKENESFIKSIMDNLPIGIAVNSVDPTVEFNYMNDNFPKYYRTSREALADPDDFWDSVYEDPEFRGKIKKRVLDDCASGDPERMVWVDVPIARRGDKTSYITARNIPIPDQQLMISTVWDVTEHKQMETQIQQSQKIESIGTLAGGIAHDFNNILFPIVGHTEMLMEDIPDDSPLHDSLNEIYTGSLRARDLVKQILTFSRQDINEIKLLRIQPVIREALKLIRSTIPTSIEIKQYIRNDCGIIKADPTQIHQVVMNLTTNAYHAMEDIGGELKVNLKEVELDGQDVISSDMVPGPYACLTIADTGMGMDKDLMEKIFDPFFTTKKQGKGTGMGLSVVHGIVKNAGGDIQVYSEPGKGTEFRIYMPVVTSASKQKGRQAEELIQGGDECILLVDDENAIARMQTLMLERLGYSVVSRTSSVEALKAFRANPGKFDLVITDMSMPNMSGDKLAAELIKIRPGIPILLCTGFSEKIPEEKAETMGIKYFLMKPITRQDLSKKIRDLLDNEESSNEG